MSNPTIIGYCKNEPVYKSIEHDHVWYTYNCRTVLMFSYKDHYGVKSWAAQLYKYEEPIMNLALKCITDFITTRDQTDSDPLIIAIAPGLPDSIKHTVTNLVIVATNGDYKPVSNNPSTQTAHYSIITFKKHNPDDLDLDYRPTEATPEDYYS